MIPLALFLARFAPSWLQPWLIGIAIGRKPERMEPGPLKPGTRVWVKKGYDGNAR